MNEGARLSANSGAVLGADWRLATRQCQKLMEMEVVANTLILLGGVILLFGAAGVIIGLILRNRRR